MKQKLSRGSNVLVVNKVYVNDRSKSCFLINNGSVCLSLTKKCLFIVCLKMVLQVFYTHAHILSIKIARS